VISDALGGVGVAAEPPLSTGLARTVLACGAPERPAPARWSEAPAEAPPQRLWSDGPAEAPPPRLWSEAPAEAPAPVALAAEPSPPPAPPPPAAIAELRDPAHPPAWLWWTFVAALVLVIALATILGSHIG